MSQGDEFEKKLQRATIQAGKRGERGIEERFCMQALQLL